MTVNLDDLVSHSQHPFDQSYNTVFSDLGMGVGERVNVAGDARAVIRILDFSLLYVLYLYFLLGMRTYISIKIPLSNRLLITCKVHK